MHSMTLKNRFYNCKNKIINNNNLHFGEFWEVTKKTFKIELSIDTVFFSNLFKKTQ